MRFGRGHEVVVFGSEVGLLLLLEAFADPVEGGSESEIEDVGELGLEGRHGGVCGLLDFAADSEIGCTEREEDCGGCLLEEMEDRGDGVEGREMREIRWCLGILLRGGVVGGTT